MSDGREPAIARAWRPLVWLLVVWGAATAANLTKAQILQQAGIAALAQANSAPQAVLSLLRG